MAITIALVGHHMPQVLAAIVEAYLRPLSMTDQSIGLSGWCELCDTAVTDHSDCLDGLCEGNYAELALRYIERRHMADSCSGVKGACRGGHIELATHLLKNDRSTSNIKAGLVGACEGGHASIADLMMATYHAENFNDGLWAACQYGHVSMVDMMIECGANDWHEGLIGACRGNQCRLAQHMIDLGADPSDGLISAAAHNRYDAARLMIENHATRSTEALRRACVNGNYAIAELIAVHGANCNMNDGLYWACEFGHMKIVTLMINLGATNYANPLYVACREGHLPIIEFLLSKTLHLGRGLEGACQNGNTSIIQLMIAYGACDWNAGLLGACRGNHYEAAKMMLTRGANNRAYARTCAQFNSQVDPNLLRLLDGLV